MDRMIYSEWRLPLRMLLFGLPLIASNLLQVLFNMADIAVVGRFAGSIALGSVGSTTILCTMFTSFLIGIAGGINVLTARYFGEKSWRDLRQTVHTALILCIIIGGTLLCIGQAGSPLFLRLLGTKEELYPGALLYLRIFFLGMPGLALYNFGSSVFSAVGDTRKPLFCLGTSGVVNVLLNVFFVVGLHWNVAGVATATVIAQYLSATLVLGLLFRSKQEWSVRLNEIHISPAKARRLLALGLPTACQNAVFYIANLFVQAGVNTFSATVVAGNAAAANSDSLVYESMNAYYTACATYVSQNYGAGRAADIRKSYHWGLGYSFGVAAIVSGLLLMFGRQFLGMFTTDAAVVEAGLVRLTIMGCSYMFSSFMDCTIAASRGLGKTIVPTVIVFMGSCVFRIIWIYTVFAHFRTIESLYLLYIFSWTLTGIAEIIYYRRIYREQTAIFA